MYINLLLYVFFIYTLVNVKILNIYWGPTLLVCVFHIYKFNIYFC